MSFADKALLNQLKKNVDDLLPILKSMANGNRLLILIDLLDGDCSFKSLLKDIPLKKTALSNHLTQLLESRLIRKANYGIYQITQDGKEYLRSLHATWHNTTIAEENQIAKLDSRKNSKKFIRSYLGSQ